MPRGIPRTKKFHSAYLASLALVMVVSVAGQPLRASVHPANLVMFYLMVVVIVALRWGRGPSMVTAAWSALAFDFFFVPPRLAFDFSDLEYLLTFFGLLVVGGVLGTMVVRVHDQAEDARHREIETSTLYALSQELTVAAQLSDIRRAASNHIQHLFGCPVEIVLPEAPGQFEARVDRPIIEWVYRQGLAAGQGTPHFPMASAHYHPLKTREATLGVMILSWENDASKREWERDRLLAASANLIALAIERIQLADAARQATLLQEKEHLQTAILSSISHDLRTPLASIMGTLSSMLSHRDTLDQASQEELLLNAWGEARRLNRLVANLLDMSRLESGAIKASFDYCDLQDLIGVALSSVENRHEKRRIQVSVADDVPLVQLDFALIERVLVNVLDNALKYSPPDSPVELTVGRVDATVQLRVADRGRGIPSQDLEHVFERFYRSGTASGVEGTGLGLAICKGIVELHQGSICAIQRPGGGTVIQIELPINQQREYRHE